MTFTQVAKTPVATNSHSSQDHIHPDDQPTTNTVHTLLKSDMRHHPPLSQLAQRLLLWIFPPMSPGRLQKMTSVTCQLEQRIVLLINKRIHQLK